MRQPQVTFGTAPLRANVTYILVGASHEARKDAQRGLSEAKAHVEPMIEWVSLS